MCVAAAAIPAAVQTLATVATTAATIAGFVQQDRQARAEERAANVARHYDYLTLQQRSLQQADQFTLRAFERQRQAARERSQIQVAAGEGGVQGSSLLRMINQSLWSEAFSSGIHTANLQGALLQDQARARQIEATHQGRVEMARSRRVNPFLATLQIGADAYRTYHSFPSIPRR